MTILTAVALTAFAATPNPDRPSVSRSGYLIAPGTLELESGLAWTRNLRAAPHTLKVAFGDPVEARLSADLAAFDVSPGLEAGLKVRVADTDDFGFCAFLGSAIPTMAGEPWAGTAQGLLTVPIDAWFVQGNLGVDLVAGDEPGSVRFGGVPAVVAVGRAFGPFSTFVEAAGTLGGGCDACGGVIDGGVGWLLTEILILDVGVGWDLDGAAPVVQAGLTANFGRVQGL